MFHIGKTVFKKKERFIIDESTNFPRDYPQESVDKNDHCKQPFRAYSRFHCAITFRPISNEFPVNMGNGGQLVNFLG